MDDAVIKLTALVDSKIRLMVADILEKFESGKISAFTIERYSVGIEQWEVVADVTHRDDIFKAAKIKVVRYASPSRLTTLDVYEGTTTGRVALEYLVLLCRHESPTTDAGIIEIHARNEAELSDDRYVRFVITA